MSRNSTEEEKKRLNLELPMRIYLRLEEMRRWLAADSVTEVIRRALTVLHTLITVREERATIIIRYPDGTERELLIT